VEQRTHCAKLHCRCGAGKLQKEACGAALKAFLRSIDQRRHSPHQLDERWERSSVLAVTIACFSNMNGNASATRVEFA
jgi:hypothetical protein